MIKWASALDASRQLALRLHERVVPARVRVSLAGLVPTEDVCATCSGSLCLFLAGVVVGMLIMLYIVVWVTWVRRQLRYFMDPRSFLMDPLRTPTGERTVEQKAAVKESISKLSVAHSPSRSRLARGQGSRDSLRPHGSRPHAGSRENLLRVSSSRSMLKRSTSRDSFCRVQSSDLGADFYVGSPAPELVAMAGGGNSSCNSCGMPGGLKDMHCSHDNLAVHLEEFASDNLPEEITDEIRGHLRARGVTMGFGGTWIQDKRRSTSLDLHLEALNVPYLARVVARSASYKAEIEQEGMIWIETTATSLLKNTTEYRLDGRVQIHPHPMDGSPVRVMTAIEGARVVTRSSYLHHGLSQVVSRWLEEDGSLYVVRNELVNKDGLLLDAIVYFNREEKKDGK